MRFRVVFRQLLMLVLVVLVSSCSRQVAPSANEVPPEAEQLEESLTDWRLLKEANGGDYPYDVYFAS